MFNSEKEDWLSNDCPIWKVYNAGSGLSWEGILVDGDMDEDELDQTDQIRKTLTSAPMEGLEVISYFEDTSSRLAENIYLRNVCYSTLMVQRVKNNQGTR